MAPATPVSYVIRATRHPHVVDPSAHLPNLGCHKWKRLLLPGRNDNACADNGLSILWPPCQAICETPCVLHGKTCSRSVDGQIYKSYNHDFQACKPSLLLSSVSRYHTNNKSLDHG